MNLDKRTFTIPKNLGFILLCAWLIAVGSVPLLGLGSVFLSMLLNILAVVAGVLMFLGR
jgi:hypothetical protein